MQGPGKVLRVQKKTTEEECPVEGGVHELGKSCWDFRPLSITTVSRRTQHSVPGRAV